MYIVYHIVVVSQDFKDFLWEYDFITWFCVENSTIREKHVRSDSIGMTTSFTEHFSKDGNLFVLKMSLYAATKSTSNFRWTFQPLRSGLQSRRLGHDVGNCLCFLCVLCLGYVFHICCPLTISSVNNVSELRHVLSLMLLDVVYFYLLKLLLLFFLLNCYEWNNLLLWARSSFTGLKGFYELISSLNETVDLNGINIVPKGKN